MHKYTNTDIKTHVRKGAKKNINTHSEEKKIGKEQRARATKNESQCDDNNRRNRILVFQIFSCEHYNQVNTNKKRTHIFIPVSLSFILYLRNSKLSFSPVRPSAEEREWVFVMYARILCYAVCVNVFRCRCEIRIISGWTKKQQEKNKKWSRYVCGITATTIVRFDTKSYSKAAAHKNTYLVAIFPNRFRALHLCMLEYKAEVIYM